MIIGHFPDMPMSEAQKRARTQRVALDDGKDPQTERLRERQAQSNQLTVTEVANRWHADEIVGRVQHPEIPKRYIDNHIVPAIGVLPIGEVQTGDVLKPVNRLKKQPRGRTAASDLLRYLQRIFKYARRQGLINADPSDMLTQRDAGGAEKSRDRNLSSEELAKLFKAMRDDGSFGALNTMTVRLLLTLGIRKRELLAAPWSEFDLDGEGQRGPVWKLPAARSKTDKGIDIPLPPLVVEDLRVLKGLAGGGAYVFSRRRHGDRSRYAHVGLDTLNAALAELDHGLEHFTVHDFRRTMRTQLASLEIPDFIAERCLNHKLRGVAGVYDRHDYFEERREALARWSDALRAVETGKRNAATTQKARSTSAPHHTRRKVR